MVFPCSWYSGSQISKLSSTLKNIRENLSLEFLRKLVFDQIRFFFKLNNLMNIKLQKPRIFRRTFIDAISRHEIIFKIFRVF